MRDRRGMIEESLRQIILLVVGIIILVVVLYASYSLIKLFFFNDNTEWYAQRNVNLLADRIAAVQDEKMTGPGASVFLSVPYEYIIIGYDEQLAQPFASLKAGDSVLTEAPTRPSGCGKACLCMYKKVETKTPTKREIVLQLLGCESLKAGRIYGISPTLEISVLGANPKFALAPRGQYYAFAIGGMRKFGGISIITDKADGLVVTNYQIATVADGVLIKAVPTG